MGIGVMFSLDWAPSAPITLIGFAVLCLLYQRLAPLGFGGEFVYSTTECGDSAGADDHGEQRDLHARLPCRVSATNRPFEYVWRGGAP
jgi:hypothetical protein